MNREDPATTPEGSNGQKSRRNAYAALLNQQRQAYPQQPCQLTFYIFNSTWNILKPTESQLKKNKQPPQLIIDSTTGFVLPTKDDQTTAPSFLLNGQWYSAHRKLHVVQIRPYVPLNVDDETSAFSTLLLHTIWPPSGEDGILFPGMTAVETLKTWDNDGHLPQYVKTMLGRISFSEARWRETGEGKSVGMKKQNTHTHN
jgi:hypothetical protein